MPFPQQPTRKKGFGISLDETVVEKIDALLSIKPGKRSEAYRDLLLEGVERRYGRDWAEKADRLIAPEGAAA